MTRLARHHRIFFLEDAMALPDGETTPRLEVKTTPEGIVVVRPMLLPKTGDADHDKQVDDQNTAYFLPALKEELKRQGFTDFIHWFYTPMAYWLEAQIPSIGVVYDCMDELSMFKNPPAGILEREQELLDCARVVFTGGRSLYLGKTERHPNVHMFASGVDVQHFGTACDDYTATPADIQAIP
ncbi:MAG: hypothetical protein LC772_02960, partial [Chloroflexi bacterium]|nr:hypothetical protein [Chloroflexota bacterium]